MERVKDNRKRRTILAAYCLNLVQWTSLAVELSLQAFIGKELGIAAVHYGYLSTIGAFCQLVSSPLYSHWASTNLRRAITIAFLSASLSYFLLAMANGFLLLLSSRLVAVFASHAAVAIQAAVAACTEPEERTAYFGKLGAATGVGFMLGPLIGGAMARVVGLRAPLFLTSAVCAIAGLLGPMFVEVERTTAGKKSDEPSGTQGVKGYLRLLSKRRVSTILLSKNLVFAPLILIMTIMGVHMINEFKIEPGQNAVSTLFIGVCMTAMNAGGVPFLKKYLEDRGLLCIGIIAFGLHGVGLILAKSYHHFFLITPFQAVAISLVASSTDGMLTSSVPPSDHALIVSLTWAVDSLIRVVGPVLAGLMLSNVGFASFGYTQLIGSLIAVCLVYLFVEGKVRKA